MLLQIIIMITVIAMIILRGNIRDERGRGFGRGLNRRGGRDISAGKEVTPRELERSRDLFGERPAHYIVLSFKLYEYLLDRRWDHGRI